MNREDRKLKLQACLESREWRITKSFIKKTFKFIWDIKFFLIFALLSFSIYQLIKFKVGDEYQMSKCGVIVDMKQTTDVKSNYITNIMYIKYGSNIESREVQNNSYYSHKKGDNICFGVLKPEIEKLSMIYFFICAGCVLILGAKFTNGNLN